MEELAGKVAVITGAGSGLGREFANTAARLGMKLVLADVNRDALAATADALRAQRAELVDQQTDVGDERQVTALADAAYAAYGAVHLLFNNAGVGSGGLIWEASADEWRRVLDANLWGVIHGIRAFVPRMLDAARGDAGYRAHIVNTASMAGLVNTPLSGVYNVSKHAVVSLSETLHHDLALVTQQVRSSVLCPFFVPTGIAESMSRQAAQLRTHSQRVAYTLMERAVSAGRVTAAQLADVTFDAVRRGDFYIFSHPHALDGVRARLGDIADARTPSDPYAARPDVRAQLEAALRR
ncbi:SDR family NAD(P)-dependent oxidoreductase [Burkholderia sp. TSV86]|uniref:SDR family NAD(P)-dependent oxidoreductase n=1 Tax=Burkholderia sp. TSV86 TaxID=1385594 RepID=UPI000756FB29|nr:SDR family NAD(P)-dependent oxidoreductase [Burkholderia sp. TSV86]KVE33594.1 hypothetical protein WS68_12060 [Burkholderia sp. TSV86]